MFYLSASFSILEECGLPIAAITCTYEDIDEGDEATILSLVWELADFFFIAKQFPDCNGLWKSRFLAWCQDCCRQSCGPRGVSVTDFHKSFQNGLALCAIVDSAVKNPNLISISALKADNAEANLTLAMSVAKRVFGAPALLNPWEFSAALPDERSTILYLAVLRRCILAGPVDPATIPPEEDDDLLRAAQRASALDGPARAPSSDPAPADRRPPADGEAAAARESLRRAMLGRPDGPRMEAEAGDGRGALSDEVARVKALLEELHDPISHVAEVLRRPGPGGGGRDGGEVAEARATFVELTEKMRRLVEVFPDTLACTQQAQVTPRLHPAGPGDPSPAPSRPR